MNNKRDVTFKSKISKSDKCFCSACHDAGWVMKVKLPETLYFDGNKLSTKYSEYWLCAKCRTKLAHALDWPEEE